MRSTVSFPLGHQSVVCLVKEAEILWWNGFVDSNDVVGYIYLKIEKENVSHFLCKYFSRENKQMLTTAWAIPRDTAYLWLAASLQSLPVVGKLQHPCSPDVQEFHGQVLHLEVFERCHHCGVYGGLKPRGSFLEFIEKQIFWYFLISNESKHF